MSLITSLVNRIARSFTRGTTRGIQQVFFEEVREELRKDLGLPPLDGKQPQEIRAEIQGRVERGEITRRQLLNAEKQLMTDYNSFMSIGLDQCGSDKETFRALTEVWNAEKEQIKEMSQAEVRQNLTCP